MIDAARAGPATTRFELTAQRIGPGGLRNRRTHADDEGAGGARGVRRWRTLWGLVLNVLPVDQDPAIRGAATIGAGGLLCICMMALVVYPQALAAFSIPLIVGVVWGIAALAA